MGKSKANVRDETSPRPTKITNQSVVKNAQFCQNSKPYGPVTRKLFNDSAIRRFTFISPKMRSQIWKLEINYPFLERFFARYNFTENSPETFLTSKIKRDRPIISWFWLLKTFEQPKIPMQSSLSKVCTGEIYLWE